MVEQYDVVIVGGGPAGLSAAAVIASHGRQVAIFDQVGFGGSLMKTAGFRWSTILEDGVSGFELAQRMESRVTALGAICRFGTVTALRIPATEHRVAQPPPGNSADAGAATVRRFLIETDDQPVAASAVVVASGSVPLPLPIDGFEAMRGRGVSDCAVCDGPLFRNQPVAVVGNDEHAAEEALFLADFAAVVHLFADTAEPRWRTATAAVLAQSAVVTVHTATRVTALHSATDARGFTRLAAVDIVPVAGGGAAGARVECAGLFGSHGTRPATDFIVSSGPAVHVPDLVTTHGALRIHRGNATPITGLFAAGSVRAGFDGELCATVADGEAAGAAVVRFLARAGALPG